jgi:hypothetical protein
MTSTEKYVSEQELNERALAPRVTLESLEAKIVSEVYFTAHQGARASLLDEVVAAEEHTDAEQVTRRLVGLHPSLRLLTICVLVLENGFTVIGQSACASPENYQEDIGRRVARGDAIRQCWALLGFELRSKLHNLSELRAVDDRLGEALTRMTAHGLGNPEALRPTDVDRIFSHFIQDHSEISQAAITGAVEESLVPVAPAFNEIEEPEYQGFNHEVEEPDIHLIERNELGAQHPDEIVCPTITPQSLNNEDDGA